MFSPDMHDVYVGGNPKGFLSSPVIHIFNASKGRIVKQLEIKGTQNYISIMKRNLQNVFCGCENGKIIMLDSRNLRIEHTLNVYADGTLIDMELSRNQPWIVATCGYNTLLRPNQIKTHALIAEPWIRIFDTRMMRALPPISCPTSPHYVKFHPKRSSELMAIGVQGGILQICDYSGSPLSEHNVHHMSVPDMFNCAGIAISASGNWIAFADSIGAVHMLQSNNNKDYSSASCAVNDNPSQLTELPNYYYSVAPDIYIDMEDYEIPLSSVGMPYYEEPLLSSMWPTGLTFKVGLLTPPLNPLILATMKWKDNIGYAPNPRKTRRNQVVDMQNQKDMEPVFRSVKEKQQQKYESKTHFSMNDMGMTYYSMNPLQSNNDPLSYTVESIMETPTLDDYRKISSSMMVSTNLPAYYRRVEIKYSKFGVEDFDFAFYNKTEFGGLETHITNSYCNAMLQVFYFQPVFRSIMIEHMSLSPESCSKATCLSCELGFLFRMLDQSQGMNCQATNFLQIYSLIPQVAALGLNEPDIPTPDTPYAILIQNFNRFILEQLHKETSYYNTNDSTTTLLPQNGGPPSPIQDVFGISMKTTNKCKCTYEIVKYSHSFAIDLIHPRKLPSGKIEDHSIDSFSKLLTTSITREMTIRIWCDKCNAYEPTNQIRRMNYLPNMLIINCGITKPEDIEMWMKKKHDGDAIGVVHSWIPFSFKMQLMQDGRVIVKEEEEEEEKDSTSIQVYDLVAYITEVKKDKSRGHLVAHIKVPDSYHKWDRTETSSWYVFNDFLVSSIPQTMVGILSGKTLIPAVLLYQRRQPAFQKDYESSSTLLDRTFLSKDIYITLKKNMIQQDHVIPLKSDEVSSIIDHPWICAIDTEFVAIKQEDTEIYSDGSRSIVRPQRFALARVSILRGSGPLEGVPFMDDYITASEPVIDYLTEFSGINPGDLDLATSPYNLTTLKAVYTKLRILIDMGCIFVGHGLEKDFRIMNLLVPSTQVVDTVVLFHMKGQRKISLKYLAWYLLGLNIQNEAHCSVEDARTSLALYKVYTEFQKQHCFEALLNDIYTMGRSVQWKSMGPRLDISTFLHDQQKSNS